MGLLFDSEKTKPEHKKEPTTMGERLLTWIFALFLAVVLASITISLLERIWVWLVVIGGAVAGLWVLLRLRDNTRGRW